MLLQQLMCFHLALLILYLSHRKKIHFNLVGVFAFFFTHMDVYAEIKFEIRLCVIRFCHLYIQIVWVHDTHVIFF